MGHISIVYGIILGAAWRSDDYHKLHELNMWELRALPEADTFPWIHRDMFHCQDPHNIQGTYRDQVILFGASYKSVEDQWPEWLNKFESILRRLYWTSATIHLNTELAGNHTYEWVMDPEQAAAWDTDAPGPVSSWEFTGGPRTFFNQ